VGGKKKARKNGWWPGAFIKGGATQRFLKPPGSEGESTTQKFPEKGASGKSGNEEGS